MSIKGKLLAGFSSIVVIILAFGMYVFNAIEKFDEISDKKAARYEQMVDLKNVMIINTDLSLHAMDAIVRYRDGANYSEFKPETTRLFKEIYALENELLEDADTEEKTFLVKDIMKSFRALEPILLQKLPNLFATNAPATAFSVIDAEIDGAAGSMEGEIEKLIKLLNVELLAAEKAEATYADNVKLFLILTIIASVVLAITISFIVSNKIGHSIEEFKDGLLGFFRYLNREDSDVQMLSTDSKDEIAKMAEVVNENIKITKAGIEDDRNFIDNTINVLTEFEQGDLCQRINIDVDNPALQQLKSVLNSMGNHMEENINEILDVLEKYTHYNYLDKVEEGNVKHHLLELSQGVNKLGDSIITMLTEEKKIGLTLSDSSHTLLQNVNILNDVSNEAAASLEETAAALEEMTSTIVSNTDNVVAMADFAHKVTKSVEEGNVLATQTTTSMDEINDQVSSINDAIAVIDQIAFQTNILSLNAAVEAATAGEAGKGFAVVAQEVRNLASRSAEAAKEIKDLVENAKDKANDGKVIADKMIHGYTDLNDNIKKTIELINHVETASKEQKSGIEQINDAVSQQDQQTQQIASAASGTYDIAVHASEISERIVANVEKKDFPNKNNIVKISSQTAKKETTKKVVTNTTTVSKETTKTPIEKKTPIATSSKLKEVTPTSSDDEWESF